MREPQEVPDREYERVLERVAAVDVAKASGMVCSRVPHPGRAGRQRTLVWEVPATTNAVLELGEHLAGERIQKVTLEATSDYWRIWFYLLEAAGLEVQLVKAHDVKQAPGRPKTDKLDAVWLAKLSRAGNRRLNHVPYIAGIIQLRHDTAGRAHYRRKLAAGKTPMEAMRCPRRRLPARPAGSWQPALPVRNKRAREGTPGRLFNPARPACPRTPALRISHFPDPHPRRYPCHAQLHSPWPPQPLPPGGAPEVPTRSALPDQRR